MTVEDWSLSDGQRQETVGRVANNISAMAFFAGSPIADDVVQAAAAAIEKKAYTVARVEARTTTGVRCARQAAAAGGAAGGALRQSVGAGRAAPALSYQLLAPDILPCAAGRTTRR
jgi:hypothetical protein